MMTPKTAAADCRGKAPMRRRGASRDRGSSLGKSLQLPEAQRHSCLVLFYHDVLSSMPDLRCLLEEEGFSRARSRLSFACEHACSFVTSCMIPHEA